MRGEAVLDPKTNTTRALYAELRAAAESLSATSKGGGGREGGVYVRAGMQVEEPGGKMRCSCRCSFVLGNSLMERPSKSTGRLTAD